MEKGDKRVATEASRVNCFKMGSTKARLYCEKKVRKEVKEKSKGGDENGLTGDH